MLSWLVVAVAIGVPTALLLAEQRRRQRLLAPGGLEARTLPDVDGHALTGGWAFVGQDDAGHPDREIWRYECRAQGVLPPWASLYLTGGDTDGGRSQVLGQALFGDDVARRIPLGWIISAEGSNLVVQGEEVSTRTTTSGLAILLLRGGAGMAPDPQVEALTAAFARSALDADDDRLAGRLATLASRDGRPEAVELLGLRLAHTEAAAEAITLAAHDPRAELRLAAARCGAPEASATMAGIAKDDALPRSLRARAVRLMAMNTDTPRLRELVWETSGDIDDVLLEALRLDQAEDTAQLALRALQHADEAVVSAAADVLARIGGRDAIEPLSRRLEAGGPRLLTTSLELTLELVRGRLGGGAGALSVVDPGPSTQRGQLSVTDEDRGALSPSDD